MATRRYLMLLCLDFQPQTSKDPFVGLLVWGAPWVSQKARFSRTASESSFSSYFFIFKLKSSIKVFIERFIPLKQPSSHLQRSLPYLDVPEQFG
jgi:hypothetical protein